MDGWLSVQYALVVLERISTTPGAVEAIDESKCEKESVREPCLTAASRTPHHCDCRQMQNVLPRRWMHRRRQLQSA